MKTFLIRGVPMAVQQDGWWLNSPPPPTPDRKRAAPAPDMARLALLVPLIALGDVLVWQVLPGLSLAVFGMAIVLAAIWVAGHRVSGQRLALGSRAALLALLPLVELVQPLSFMIAVVGVSAMLAVLAGLHRAELWRGALRLWPMGVRQTFVDAGAFVRPKEMTGLPEMAMRLIMTWLFPLALGLVFALLLLEANPIAQRWVQGLGELEPNLPAMDRLAFWLVLVPVGWTALSLSALRDRLRVTPVPRKMGPHREGLINPASVTRALVLFNLVFALQTGMDVIVLYGGVGLPEGITYAQYAHRGAYPLVATALLAGSFALLTRRWTEGHALLRLLLMVWVAQNVALVISSLVRLELYVEVYGLTRLRLSAAIWMGMVAAGLGLILWQVWQRLTNTWLMLRGGAMAAGVLYSCAWMSFDAAIARYNLSHPVRQDVSYLCHLGDAARPVIARAELARGARICHGTYRISVPRDWREWGFRNWRARNSLGALQAQGTR